jgi:hypothetical protein
MGRQVNCAYQLHGIYQINFDKRALDHDEKTRRTFEHDKESVDQQEESHPWDKFGLGLSTTSKSGAGTMRPLCCC